MTRLASSITRHCFLAAVFVVGIFTIVASNGGSGGGTTGAISVTTGFGAVSTPPYQCTGQGQITITPLNLTGTTGKNQTQSQPITHSGFSSTTPNECACKQGKFFGDLRTGTWQVTDGNGTCTATVNAGQSATVVICNGACR